MFLANGGFYSILYDRRYRKEFIKENLFNSRQFLYLWSSCQNLVTMRTCIVFLFFFFFSPEGGGVGLRLLCIISLVSVFCSYLSFVDYALRKTNVEARIQFFEENKKKLC